MIKKNYTICHITTVNFFVFFFLFSYFFCLGWYASLNLRLHGFFVCFESRSGWLACQDRCNLTEMSDNLVESTFILRRKWHEILIDLYRHVINFFLSFEFEYFFLFVLASWHWLFLFFENGSIGVCVYVFITNRYEFKTSLKFNIKLWFVASCVYNWKQNNYQQLENIFKNLLLVSFLFDFTSGTFEAGILVTPGTKHIFGGDLAYGLLRRFIKNSRL